MDAEFHVKFKISFPKVSDKQKMTQIVNTIVGDITEQLDEDVVSVELLNHTLVFRG